MNITKETLRDFRKDFKNTVRALEKENEITIEMLNITYEFDGTGFRFKVIVTNASNPEDAKKLQFEKVLREYGWKYDELTPDHFEMEVNSSRLGECKLVGIAPRSPKRPMLIEQASTGKIYKTSYDVIERHISIRELKTS